jgi:hypothetical protein
MAEGLRENWVAALGWTIFVGLMIALLAGHYVFNPFIFGFAYYVSFVIAQTAKTDASWTNLNTKRLFLVCLICLMYLGFAVMNEYHRSEFIGHFERTCDRGRYADIQITQELCTDIQSHIDNYLRPQSDDE